MTTTPSHRRAEEPPVPATTTHTEIPPAPKAPEPAPRTSRRTQDEKED